MLHQNKEEWGGTNTKQVWNSNCRCMLRYFFVRISNGKYKMAANLVGFQIVGIPNSDIIRNPDHLLNKLFLTMQNPDKSRFQIPTEYKTSKFCFSK